MKKTTIICLKTGLTLNKNSVFLPLVHHICKQHKIDKTGMRSGIDCFSLKVGVESCVTPKNTTYLGAFEDSPQARASASFICSGRDRRSK